MWVIFSFLNGNGLLLPVSVGDESNVIRISLTKGGIFFTETITADTGSDRFIIMMPHPLPRMIIS